MDTIEEKCIALRHLLHENAELSDHEEKTIQILKSFLKENTSMDVKDCGKWLYAKYCGNPSDDEWIALRADMDALPSQNGEAAHLCGHDGHSAALCYTGMLLEKYKVPHNVILLFQPAEEIGTGAEECLPLFEQENVKEIYGCHNLPGYPFGKVFTSMDTFACASVGIEMSFTGKITHASCPENGISPASLMGKLLEKIDELNAKGKSKLCLITVIGADMGSHSYGVAAGYGQLRVTVRAKTDEDLEESVKELTGFAREESAAEKLEYAEKFLDPFPATVNDPACARHILNSCHAELLEKPMRWSEDFGTFLQHKRGAFFGIGSGEECPGLHTEKYEYPDELLRFTALAFLGIVTSDEVR